MDKVVGTLTGNYINHRIMSTNKLLSEQLSVNRRQLRVRKRRRFTNELGDENLLFPDDYIVVNMSVWENHEALHDFVYKTVHSYFIKSRKRWFHQLGHPHTALWWVEKGEIPDLLTGKNKLALLDQEGPSEAVFTFSKILGNPI